jgi:hypothetical protein
VVLAGGVRGGSEPRALGGLTAAHQLLHGKVRNFDLDLGRSCTRHLTPNSTVVLHLYVCDT